MNADRRVVDALAGYKYGQQATCGNKVAYTTELKARETAALMSIKRGRLLEAYRCVWCDNWHIGRAMTEPERSEWMETIEGIPLEGDPLA